MVELTCEFEDAFHHSMLYEVGPFWDPNDEDVIAGNIETREQRKKVGYVNIPEDRGGETKYGLAQESNPHLIVRNLDLQSAMRVYFEKYWLGGRCDRLPFPLTILHYDGCVNHGTTRAVKFLQTAAGVSTDGIIGEDTLLAIEQLGQVVVIQNISTRRAKFYHNIVARNPSQKIFLNGWLRRIGEVTEYTLDALGQPSGEPR